jgi:non-ribosomal peptide synthetase component E (peptide arylation enzyme)
MKLARKVILPAVAAGAILAGAPAVFAATTAGGTVVAAEAPHAAAHLTAADRAAATASPMVPSAFKWLYWGTYPTLHACNAEGDHLVLAYSIEFFKCPAYSAGYYIDYELWVVLGMPPGS